MEKGKIIDICDYQLAKGKGNKERMKTPKKKEGGWISIILLFKVLRENVKFIKVRSLWRKVIKIKDYLIIWRFHMFLVYECPKKCKVP